MTDRIEKIVSKWGFTLADRDEMKVQYFRNYRGVKLYINVFTESYSPYTKVQLDCIAKSEDSKTASMRFEIGKTLYDISTDKQVEFILKDNIKKFLNEFFAYDLFHDKEWKENESNI